MFYCISAFKEAETSGFHYLYVKNYQTLEKSIINMSVLFSRLCETTATQRTQWSPLKYIYFKSRMNNGITLTTYGVQFSDYRVFDEK